MVESQCGLIAVITALFAAATFFINERSPSLSASLLLRDIVLMLVVSETVFATARTESGLLASQVSLADNAKHFYMTSKVGLQAYHIQI